MLLCCCSSSRCDINLIKHDPITSHEAGADQKTAPNTQCAAVCCATPFALHRFAIGCHHQPSNRTRLKSPHCVSVGLTHLPLCFLSYFQIFKQFTNKWQAGGAHRLVQYLCRIALCVCVFVSAHDDAIIRVLHAINIKQRVLLLFFRSLRKVPDKNVTKSLSFFCSV